MSPDCGFHLGIGRLVASLIGLLVVCSGCEHHKPVAPQSPADTSLAPDTEGRRSPVTTNAGDAESETSQSGTSALFLAIPPREAGVSFVHVSGISEKRHFPAVNGSGMAIFDADRDGHQDLIFATSCEVPIPATSEVCLTSLYLGGGDWKFRDVGVVAGMGFDGFVAGVAIADFDGDGFSDVLLSCFGPHRFHRNLGDGTFVEASSAFPENNEFSAGACWADVDDDGFPDVYVCNYGQWSQDEDRWCGNRRTGARAFCDPTHVTPVADALYRNSGDGKFEDLTAHSGIGEKIYRGQHVLATHLNDDHRIDFYVANDAHPNCLYLNEGGFQFREVAEECGAALDAQGRAQASMGIAVGDINHDGLTELFVTNYTGEHNTLYRRVAPLLFLDQSASLGVARASVPLVGWGTVFRDFDLDGWEDLIVVNGHTDPVIAETQSIPYEQKTHVYRNLRGHFQLLDECIQNEQITLGSSRGLACGDLDGDLDTDIIFGNQNAAPGLLQNLSSSGAKKALLITLIGRTSCRDATGSTVALVSERSVMHSVFGGGSYLSTSAPSVLVCPASDHTGEAEITWPSGRVSRATGLTAGRHYIILEPEEGSERVRVTPIPR